MTRHSGPKAADGMTVEEDVVCNACGSGDQGESILLCDSCDAGWHIECLEVSTPHALQAKRFEESVTSPGSLGNSPSSSSVLLGVLLTSL